MTAKPHQLTVNGQAVNLTAEAEMPLLWALRDGLGILGPKFYEGDNQSPEGFYVVGRRDLKWQTRHHRAFNIGFPNAFDKLHGRTGSNILVHVGCSTEGCFAMTNPVIDEVFRLANSAIASGQN